MCSLANLPLRHYTCYLPCSPPFRVADPTRASCPNLPHGPVDPFLIFLLTDLNRLQPQFTLTLGAILKPSVARTLSPHPQSA
ncbi:unnamed protein product [Protopolystoma xenopodis]|uniref:Uncharacterized protein n=1 Tax=Protopolystoma xenopodis TaxID=117903 RepID=A0A3S5CMP7_9PLAT|nr:unnamed protein product [Protopolystoma xenopodis]